MNVFSFIYTSSLGFSCCFGDYEDHTCLSIEFRLPFSVFLFSFFSAMFYLRLSLVFRPLQLLAAGSSLKIAMREKGGGN